MTFPRYKVCLHRPADRGLMAVVRAVVDLTRFAAAEAEFRMWEAFHRGRAVVLVTHLERAELYVEQFAARPAGEHRAGVAVREQHSRAGHVRGRSLRARRCSDP